MTIARVIVTCCICAVPITLPDWITAPPVVRIFASEDGVYGLRVSLQESKDTSTSAQLTLFTYDNKGVEKVLWNARLPYTPNRAIVANTKQVLCLNDHWHRGYEHSLAVLDENGVLIADYRLEDLLSSDEIRQLPHTTSSRIWSNGSKVSFADGLAELVLKTGRTLKVDLTSGKVKRD